MGGLRKTTFALYSTFRLIDVRRGLRTLVWRPVCEHNCARFAQRWNFVRAWNVTVIGEVPKAVRVESSGAYHYSADMLNLCAIVE